MTNNLTLDGRVGLMQRLGLYMAGTSPEWVLAKDNAAHDNTWFTAEHIELAAANIAAEFLQKDKLEAWVAKYKMPVHSRKVGIVMAGNIPFVGFHDLLCGFISGHELIVKLSSKDETLMKHLISWMIDNEPGLASTLVIAERLNGCDAYIATGSNNTARYFEQYFGKYPHIIRRNRTSVAILDGSETDEELMLLGHDVYMYYGLGCRNVTQVCVPQGYDFEPLIRAFRKYDYYADLNKYKNNYDYHLALYLLNKVQYMSTESLLVVENDLPFSAVSVLHYRNYTDMQVMEAELQASGDIQAIVGHGHIPFGKSQTPSLSAYADGADTMAFLCEL